MSVTLVEENRSPFIIPLIALPLPELLRLTDATSNSSRVFWASVVKAAAITNRSVVPIRFRIAPSEIKRFASKVWLTMLPSV